MQSRVVGRYLTRTGKTGATITRWESPRGAFYSYTGEWGAGSGLSAHDMQRAIATWLERKKGARTVLAFQR
jgi:hypothetical protein